jgi:hypothetical protein
MEDYYRGRFQRKSRYSTEFVLGCVLLGAMLFISAIIVLYAQAFVSGYLGV